MLLARRTPMPQHTRRQFCQTLTGVVSTCALARAQGQEPWSGTSIIDCHHHMRRAPEANIQHLDGCGVSNALILARDNSAEQIEAIRSKYPGRVLGWFASTDITKPEAESLLAGAIHNCAAGFGEIK